MGWSLARYVPNNGYIAVGELGLQAPTQRLSFVQWVEIYQPFQKHAHLPRDGAARPLIFELPTGPDLDEAIAAIRGVAEGPIRVDRGSLDTLVYATMSRGQAEKLLHHGLVIGVGPETSGIWSDERQVMSLTMYLNAQQSAPTHQTQYWAWVLSNCPNCSSMPHGTWRVGFVDTGLDNGLPTGGHADLAGRKDFGTVFQSDSACPVGQPACDYAGHGTFVTGIAVGSRGTGLTDSGGFYYGQGVAQTAGAFMTTAAFGPQPSKILQYTADAAANGVTIQNHSFNEDLSANDDTSGTYSQTSRRYDIAVRDADDAASPARTPIFVAVSAGNNTAGAQTSARYYVLPGGTAKNVLSVSGMENSRGQTCGTCASESFQNIMKISRVGTLIPGYIKPDVLAPASAIVSTHTSARDQTFFNYCFKNVGGVVDYAEQNGTSFAAPVGAGAALIVKRYLGATPSATSPALTKAMLIAGARSIKGGLDRTHDTETTIGPVPSTQQGYGRLSFEDILTGNTPPVTYDQVQGHLLTSSGQSLSGRLRVLDSNKPVKVVLVWTDPPATVSTSGVNPLVNDLNLEVIPPGGGAVVYLGNRLSATEVSTAFPVNQPLTPDDVNNVEYARFVLGTNEQFDVVIKAARISGDIDGNSSFEQDFALVVVNATVVSPLLPQNPPPSPPQNLLATASGTSVTVSWSPVTGAISYVVERKASSAAWVALPPTTQTSLTDTPSSPSGVVLYRVVANNGSGQSAPSNTDVAFVGTFTDGTNLTIPSLTPLRAVHVTEIRRAVNALREIGNLVPGAIYSPDDINPATLQSQNLYEAHRASLMLNLSDARTAAGMATGWSFRSPVPAVNGEILRTHLEDLRRGFD